MIDTSTALIVVDMQNYYLDPESSYFRYFNSVHPGCLDYIIDRCKATVIPNIDRLIKFFRDRNLPVIYLRLCGSHPDRTDLHHFFRETHIRGKRAGFDNIYPLDTDPFSDIIDQLKPCQDDIIVKKTTFSPFTGTDIDARLKKMKISTIVCAGLATSQCVETTARDASDRGYFVVHMEDAQADYDEASHSSSLYSSQGVCGGLIFKTEEFMNSWPFEIRVSQYSDNGKDS